MTHFIGLRGKIKSLRKSNSHYKNALWLKIFLSFQFVKKASEKLTSMSDAFFGRLVPSEDLVLKTPNMAISMMLKDSAWEMDQANSNYPAALEI